jgi:hypothetical protein
MHFSKELPMNAHGKLGMALLIVLGVSVSAEVNAQTAAAPAAAIQPSDRGKMLELVAKGDSPGAEKLHLELQAQLNAGPPSPGVTAANSGSIFYEELKGCGFYPQETRLECVIEIKRNSGYSGNVGAIGSMEHVYFCVDWNNSGTFTQLESVGQGSVQMHDGGGPPPWSYAVYRDINLFGGPRTSAGGPGAVTQTNAPSVRVQATLSWNFAPTGCNYVPVWGNTVVFQVRLDPIR